MVSPDRHERGSVAPLMAVAVLLVGAMVMAVARLGEAATSRAAARTAADASALAGAAEGRDAAQDLAAANGAQLVEFHQVATDTWVKVRVGDAEAVARARREAVQHGGAAVSP